MCVFLLEVLIINPSQLIKIENKFHKRTTIFLAYFANRMRKL